MQNALKYRSDVADVGLGIKIYVLRVVRLSFHQVSSHQFLLLVRFQADRMFLQTVNYLSYTNHLYLAK